jgi:hypothetical protein
MSGAKSLADEAKKQPQRGDICCIWTQLKRTTAQSVIMSCGVAGSAKPRNSEACMSDEESWPMNVYDDDGGACNDTNAMTQDSSP